MKLHGYARSCPNSRVCWLIGFSARPGRWRRRPRPAGVTERWTVYRWLARWRQEGDSAVRDRTSCPHRSPRRLPAAKVELIRSLRKLRATDVEIAEILGRALSTVSSWLKRIGSGKRDAPGALRCDTKPAQ